MRLFGGVSPADWLIVGLGNPGSRYEGTPHNVGFEVARELIRRWGLGEPKQKFNGLLTEGRMMGSHPPGPKVAVLLPQTFMNEAGTSVSPARGATRVELDRVLVVHDEIDLPFGDIRPRVGGGLAGHNGLKSLKAQLGSAEFARVRVGVGRPDSTDPDVVASYVLGKWRQPAADVRGLVSEAADAAERVVRDGSA
jgi:peptidyl-tRNA hydrolase, PTH1 family